MKTGLVPWVLCMVTLTVPGLAQRLAPGPQQVQVLSAGDDQPLAGVTVRLGGRWATTGADGFAVFHGVPGGSYPLVVEQLGYERLEQTALLPQGKREPITLRLTPVTPVGFDGEVVLAGDGRPLAGAKVSLIPTAVAAAVQGRYDFTTDWDGKFTVLEIPPGMYQVKLAAAGCLDSVVNLAVTPDMPAPRFELAPETHPADLTVTVQDAESRRPVPGARVVLAEAWPRGMVGQATTDANGQARFSDLRVGRLNWEAFSPPGGFGGVWLTGRGFMEFQQDGRVMRARFSHFAGKLEGTLAADGRTVEGVWSMAPSYQGPADGGLVTLALSEDGNALDGRWSWGDAEPSTGWGVGRRTPSSTTSVCRSTAVVYVQAEGFEPTMAPCRIEPGAQALVTLNSAQRIEEQEPNDDLGAAQPIRTGAPVVFRIGQAQDQDCFRFRLGSPANVRVVMGPGNALAMNLELLAADGSYLYGTWGYAGHDVSVGGWLPAGEYLIRAGARDGAAVSDAPFTLRVYCDKVWDAFEPNDSMDAARPLRPGEEARGYLAPNGDMDWYRLEIKRSGAVRLTLAPSALTRSLSLVDSQGTERIADWHYPYHSLRLECFVESGVYFIRVSARSGGESTAEPYSLRVEVIEDDGVDDPPVQPGQIAAVRDLPLGTQTAATSWPAGDADVYRLTIPSAGRLHLYTRAVMNHDVRLVSSAGEDLWADWHYGGRSNNQTWDFSAPTVVYVVVNGRGGSCSPSPHIVRAFFEPADEVDAVERNDTPQTATPLNLGDTVHANLLPAGDRDWYHVDVDFPGMLEVSAQAPITYNLQVCDESGNQLAADWHYPGRVLKHVLEVRPGGYLVEISERGHGGNSSPYRLDVKLVRCEPVETVPLADDAVRLLKLGEAQSWRADHVGDVDRFRFAVVQEGPFWLRVWSGVTFDVRLTDARTGEAVLQTWEYGGQRVYALQAKGPSEYLLELNARGAGRSTGQEWVLVDLERRDIPAATVTATADPYDPTQVIFSRTALEGSAPVRRVHVDADGDGNSDLDIPPEAPATFRYPAEGLYVATVWLEGDNGVVTRVPIWVESQGVRERVGVHVTVDHPGEGQIVERDAPVRVRAMSYTGARIVRVDGEVDGQRLAPSYSPPFLLELPWRELRGAEHRLKVTATDARGQSATVQRRFRVSDYFDLQPPDGATVSGNHVRVTWSGNEFGPARVRYRPRGQQDWQEAVGENGRDRVVLLRDLEPGVIYEFQPLGGGEPGPIRSVTRVKGLAFGKPRYGANINRDYDQRVPISVRNHGDQPLTVTLVCGKPDDPDLLVGFVGEGSEGAPVALAPGEERDFLLCFSAQDATRPLSRVPIRVLGPGGLADETEVEVHVRLPEVKLEWTDLGPTPTGIGRRLRLTNLGDGLTDLAIRSENPEVVLSPSVEHGILPPGQSMEITARPRLYAGFTGVATRIVATAVGKSVEFPLRLAVPEGEAVYAATLIPGQIIQEAGDPNAALLEARILAGSFLDPEAVDWSLKREPSDMDGDGKPDRWRLFDEDENALWVGDDTDGDGEVDFVHADLGADGIFEFSAMKDKAGAWRPANLVEAWLEMGFSLPWARSSYEKHDVDILVNDQVVGQLRDVIPEGNYRFRIPPTALRFNAQGLPEGNVVGIRSTHLRGGHYVVSSDFRINLRLTGTRTWVIAPSQEEAQARAGLTEGVALTGPDYSVSSAELIVSGPATLEKGTDVVFTVPVRNIGATGGRAVEVALAKMLPTGERIELARVSTSEDTLSDSTLVRVPWVAAAGTHDLRIVVDPDQKLGDLDYSNNEASISVNVAGDDAPPTVTIQEPADGSTVADTLIPLRLEAADDSGFVAVEARVDNGLWTTLNGRDTYSATALLQPGPHTITVRATDSGGNRTEKTLRVTVTAPAPRVEILEPQPGATLATRRLTVRFRVEGPALLGAARVNGGAWRRAFLRDGNAEVEVPLSFGPATIEVMAASPRGAQGTASVDIQCTLQPEPGQMEAAEAPVEQGMIEIQGLGSIDMFGPANRILPPNPPLASGERPRAGGEEPRTDTAPAAQHEPASEAAPEGQTAVASPEQPASPTARDEPTTPRDPASGKLLRVGELSVIVPAGWTSYANEEASDISMVLVGVDEPEGGSVAIVLHAQTVPFANAQEKPAAVARLQNSVKSQYAAEAAEQSGFVGGVPVPGLVVPHGEGMRAFWLFPDNGERVFCISVIVEGDQTSLPASAQTVLDSMRFPSSR